MALANAMHDTGAKLSRATRVKNKCPAPVQITAEQILREARELHDLDTTRARPKHTIADADELSEYRLRERNRFEDLVRRAGQSVSTATWVKYARWEEAQKEDHARARSIYERALAVADHHRDHSLWVKYAEFEMRGRRVNHARNVWHRAVTLLPCVDQLWHKYVHMEELLGAVANARQVLEQWIACRRPGSNAVAWKTYIKLELRYGEVERARAIYERFVAAHPTPDTFVRYAKFEMKHGHGDVERARRVYERAAEEDDGGEALYAAFAEFEEMCGEVERARVIYEYALGKVVTKGSRAELDLRGKFMAFKRRFGERDDGVEVEEEEDATIVVGGKRKKNIIPAIHPAAANLNMSSAQAAYKLKRQKQTV